MTLKRVLECLPTLDKIAKCKSSRERLKLLKEAKECIFYAISEISVNVLNGNIRVSSYRKNQLKPYQNEIRKLSRKSTSLPERKRIIVQSGGFLPSILIPASTVLADLVLNK